MTQKHPSPKKSIARSNGPNGTQGPSSVFHRSVARSGSKYRPSQKDDGSARWPGEQYSAVPGPKKTVAFGKTLRAGRQWSKCAWL